MEIVRSQRQLAAAAAAASGGGSGAGGLPTYRVAPQLEVRLEEFELFAIDRLRVLKGISDGLSRGKRPEEMEKLVSELWKAHMRHQDPAETLNKDIISHFVLRLVYCRTEELRKWFLSMETTLFRYRFRLESPDTQRLLMSEFQLPYKALPHSEFEVVKDKLSQVARSIGQSASEISGNRFAVDVGEDSCREACLMMLGFFSVVIIYGCVHRRTQKLVESVFFKVPFEEVPDLVGSRRVFISKGYAYVAMTQVVSLVVTQFRCNISKALVLTNRKWTTSIKEQEKDRLTPIVEALSNAYFGPDYSQTSNSAEISPKDIDQLSRTSFPLCMRHMLEKLRENHHLKNGGRMQFGLFLKGAGLKLEDALAFFRAEFSQKVGSERFDKEYAYGIRHKYGKEGKRTDYTPFSCQKIISATPGVGDHHGCPYRHFGDENLRAALSSMGISGNALEGILDKVKNRHYQLACTLTFEATHNVSCDTGINHPNQYFSESQKVLQARNQTVQSQSST